MTVKADTQTIAALPPDFDKLPIAERMEILKQLRETHDALQRQQTDLDSLPSSVYFVQN